ncbi:hypothetical protein Tco_0307757 [Tanacetum coccineum]
MDTSGTIDKPYSCRRNKKEIMLVSSLTLLSKKFDLVNVKAAITTPMRLSCILQKNGGSFDVECTTCTESMIGNSKESHLKAVRGISSTTMANPPWDYGSKGFTL